MKKNKDKQNNYNWDAMNNFQTARWAALVEAVNIIGEKADDKKRDFKKISFKQSALKKYVDVVGDIVCKKLNEAEKDDAKINC